jgi:hypothetical protein
MVLGFIADPHTSLDELEPVVIFESSSDSGDEEWDADDPFAVPGPKILTYPMKEPIIEFHLDSALKKRTMRSLNLIVPNNYSPQILFNDKCFWWLTRCALTGCWPHSAR